MQKGGAAWTAVNERTAVLELLLQKGADPNVKDNVREYFLA